jgi:heme exporter protein A
MTFSGHSLSCLRGQSLVFEDISFSVAPGKMLALTGANGSGKTSLLRVMAGLLPPASGTLLWNGKDEMPEGAVHWIGPDNALKPDLTVTENMEFWFSSQPLPSGRGKIVTALLQLSLSPFADTPVRCLSVGQKRRAALCRLFLSPRPLWLLDEPETGLDAASAEKLRGLVRTHVDGGGIAVIATHRPDVWGADSHLDMRAA